MNIVKRNAIKLILLVTGISILAVVVNLFYTESLSKFVKPEDLDTSKITYDADMTFYENMKRGWRNLTGKAYDDLHTQLQDLSKAGYVIILDGVETSKTLDELMYGYNLYVNTDEKTISYTVLEDLDSLSEIHYLASVDIDLD